MKVHCFRYNIYLNKVKTKIIQKLLHEIGLIHVSTMSA